MRNFIYLLLLICAPILVMADDVKIEINPPKPVAGEVFQAYFRIFTDAAEAPEINFSPGGLEVVNKSNQGVSTRTIYANGQLSVTRELTVVYDLVANKAGLAQLKDINVQLGAKKIRHPLINITVMKEAEVMPDVFVMADVPKKKVFSG